MYDWANSVYATIIMAAVFPIYFTTISKTAGFAGDVWWGYTSSLSSLAIALTAPFLGAIGDFKGMKKRLLTAFLIIGVVFTLLMAITDNPVLMLVGYAVSYVGFAGGNLFYDSFLTDVTTRERMDRISSLGFAMGYMGGSTIPFIISIALITFGDAIGINGTLAVKISVVMTSVWWLVFSIPLMKNVKQQYCVDTPPDKLARNALVNMKKTFVELCHNKRLLSFMIAYFFYIDGVGTVITMSTSYGGMLGLGSTAMILALLLTQLLAVPFSILFGRLAERVGTYRMLMTGVAVYFIICIVGFYMGFSLEPYQAAYEKAYTSAVYSADSGLDEDTLSVINTNGLAILAQSDRLEQFDSIISGLSEADETKKAGLEKLKTSVDAFLSDSENSKEYTDAMSLSTKLFWLLAILVSTSQGGLQALSRSFFGKQIPPERSNENYGFFDIFGKFATVIGPALYAFSAAASGRSSVGILSLLLLFGMGFAILAVNRRHMQAN